MGSYWDTNSNTPTPLGTLVSAAKDQDCVSSTAQLASQFFAFIEETDFAGLSKRSSLSRACESYFVDAMVVPIPSGRPIGKASNEKSARSEAKVPKPHSPPIWLVEELSRSAARALGGQYLQAITRRNSSEKMRYSPPALRPEMVKSAGFEVKREVDGSGQLVDKLVFLVDDVFLTGTTLDHVAGILKSCGASRVVGLVAARTRLGTPHDVELLARC